MGWAFTNDNHRPEGLMTQTNEFDFDFDADDSFKTREVPVKYRGKKYILREADGESSAEYRDMMLSATIQEIDDEGSVKIRRVTGLSQYDLKFLSMCLMETNAEGEILCATHGTPSGTFQKPITIKQQELVTWPDRILKKLIKKLKVMSGLLSEDKQDGQGQEKQELGKKSQTDTDPGSA